MFRTALFSSGNKGIVLESMHVIVTTEETLLEFPIWSYDDGKGEVKGSGLFVGASGHSAYHHFAPLNDEHVFAYTGEKYEVEIWASTFHVKKDQLLGRYKFDLDDANLATKLAHGGSGVLWNWSPSARNYSPEPFGEPPT